MKSFLARFSDNSTSNRHTSSSKTGSGTLALDRYATVPASGRKVLTKRPSNPQAQAAQDARARVVHEATSSRRPAKPASIMNVPPPSTSKHQRSHTVPQPGYVQQPSTPTQPYAYGGYPQQPNSGYPAVGQQTYYPQQPTPSNQLPTSSSRPSREKDRYRSREPSRDRERERDRPPRERDGKIDRDRDRDREPRSSKDRERDKSERERDREKRKEKERKERDKDKARELRREDRNRQLSSDKPSRYDDRGRDPIRVDEHRAREPSVARPSASGLLVSVSVPEPRPEEGDSSDSSLLKQSGQNQPKRKLRRTDDHRLPAEPTLVVPPGAYPFPVPTVPSSHSGNAPTPNAMPVFLPGKPSPPPQHDRKASLPNDKPQGQSDSENEPSKRQGRKLRDKVKQGDATADPRTKESKGMHYRWPFSRSRSSDFNKDDTVKPSSAGTMVELYQRIRNASNASQTSAPKIPAKQSPVTDKASPSSGAPALVAMPTPVQPVQLDSARPSLERQHPARPPSTQPQLYDSLAGTNGGRASFDKIARPQTTQPHMMFDPSRPSASRPSTNTRDKHSSQSGQPPSHSAAYQYAMGAVTDSTLPSSAYPTNQTNKPERSRHERQISSKSAREQVAAMAQAIASQPAEASRPSWEGNPSRRERDERAQGSGSYPSTSSRQQPSAPQGVQHPRLTEMSVPAPATSSKPSMPNYESSGEGNGRYQDPSMTDYRSKGYTSGYASAPSGSRHSPPTQHVSSKDLESSTPSTGTPPRASPPRDPAYLASQQAGPSSKQNWPEDHAPIHVSASRSNQGYPGQNHQPSQQPYVNVSSNSQPVASTSRSTTMPAPSYGPGLNPPSQQLYPSTSTSTTQMTPTPRSNGLLHPSYGPGLNQPSQQPYGSTITSVPQIASSSRSNATPQLPAPSSSRLPIPSAIPDTRQEYLSDRDRSRNQSNGRGAAPPSPRHQHSSSLPVYPTNYTDSQTVPISVMKRQVSDESLLKTPSSLAKSLLPVNNPSRTSIPASLSSQAEGKKKGILGIFKSSKAAESPSGSPYEIWHPPSKDDSGEKDHARRRSTKPRTRFEEGDLSSSGEEGLVQIATALANGRRAPPPAPIPIPIPIHATGGGNGRGRSPNNKVFTPFKYLTTKRNRTMSAASVEAVDGTANNTVGSPTASMHSTQNPPQPPPLRDPQQATWEWRDRGEADALARHDLRKGRFRPGVVFDVPQEIHEDKHTRVPRGRLRTPPPPMPPPPNNKTQVLDDRVMTS
ncbi:hypothetical protein DL96DRAFT_1810201 [Flagelloscypha sp. PMI_526]|nr:hypothetical protein DL96DRAFT_1810201 [Flagelloscypha sp. PMI_526]